VELRGFEPLTSCMPSSERLSKRSWSLSFALLITGLELYRYGPLVTVVVPSRILQTSSKLDARPHPYQACPGDGFKLEDGETASSSVGYE
jgi:hypothetical protein